MIQALRPPVDAPLSQMNVSSPSVGENEHAALAGASCSKTAPKVISAVLDMKRMAREPISRQCIETPQLFAMRYLQQ